MSIEFISCPQESSERLGDASVLGDLKKVCNVCWLGKVGRKEFFGFSSCVGKSLVCWCGLRGGS